MFKAVVNQVWLTWKLLLDRRVPFWMKALLALPLIYVLSPIDLIPDFIIGLGQLDDLGLFCWGCASSSRWCRITLCRNTAQRLVGRHRQHD